MTARLAPADLIAHTTDDRADVFCAFCAYTLGITATVTRADLTNKGTGRVDCDHCSHLIIPVDHFTPAATADVSETITTVCGTTVEPGSTGGGCMALRTVLPNGQVLMATNMDAQLPDGWDVSVHLYDSDENEEYLREVFEGPHDMAALTAALTALMGA